MSSDDDWETDPDAINDVSEKQQRWGNKGTGKMVDLKAVQAEVRKADEDKAKTKSGFQRGYGGAHGHEASGARHRVSAPACACGVAGTRLPTVGCSRGAFLARRRPNDRIGAREESVAAQVIL